MWYITPEMKGLKFVKREKDEETKYTRYNKKRPVLAIRVEPLVKKRINTIAEKKEISVNEMLEPIIENWLIEQE